MTTSEQNLAPEVINTNSSWNISKPALQSVPVVGRGTPPTVWTVLLVTLLFGIVGIIPAVIQSFKATSVNHGTIRYWVSWVTMWIPCMLLWMVILHQRA
jgi:hypothetical protein